MKSFCSLCLCTLLCLAACTHRSAPTGESGEVPFQVAHGYFFKNGQPLPENPKITSRDVFDRLFGMATVMGPNGRPTVFDFETQFVVAVVLPVTDRATEIEPLTMACADNKLRYTYRVTEGEPQSFSMQPVSLVVVDKKYGDLPLELVKQ